MTIERPVLRWFGGKYMLAPWIIEHMPPHRIYTEAFGGAASVLMRKPRAYAEIYNDLEQEVVNVFRVLRSRVLSQRLERSLRLTPFARDEFERCYGKERRPVEKARRTIIRSFMGFGSNSANPLMVTGFRANSMRSGTTPAHDWANYPDEVRGFCERLTGVTIENRDALDVMKQHDSSETLHFVDPPYDPATRSDRHSYRHEMGASQHEVLVSALKELRGMVLLCGYDTPLYASLGWERIERRALADGARERTEVLWMNPSCVAAQSQVRMAL